ncbi:uncharacterized protein [Aegilops tauschii subsp. strangulata]|uniref:uncharacterized protein n=1 Tax=Aegilops tauschii subsp. strangulata TaxID=200361 RepID=UPI003CC88E93
MRASAVGVRIVLPGTFPGGDRDMKKRHMDAMAIVHTYGKPDIFLTMTCNPKWEEITNELLPGQMSQDRPDIVAPVFYGKLEAMKDMLLKKMVLGVVVAYVVAFNAQADLKNVVSSENASKSMLTEYFKANKKNTLGQGHIVSVNPAEGERYYLRVLLNHVTGKTGFEDLLTVDGVVCGRFREAAERLGLIEADNTLDDYLTEAEQWAMPCSLRRLFATILVHCEPGDVRGLWDRHLEPMPNDYRRTRTSPNEVEQMVLLDIRGMLQSMGKYIIDFALPTIDDAFDPTKGEAREIIEESTVEFYESDTKLSSSLNLEQRAAYDEILSAVERGDGGVFFLDGPGGTGKTFLYRAMLAKVRGEGKIAIATATLGVAASIMPGGRTAHSRFKIPPSCDDGASCSFTKQSGTAKLLRMASLILWDEASMTKRQAVEALDNSMRDIMGIRD